MRYNNYHKHDHYGNFISLDTITKIEDYCKRAVELGHTTIFTTNHGFQGNLFQTYTLAQQYNLKMIVGVEAYYVEDRFEKDKTNNHLIIIAKNNNGVRQINKIMSEANNSGFYYKPRIDKNLLFTLNPNDVIITSACIAGIWNNEPLIKEIKSHFKNNFYLEVQNHNTNSQIKANKKILELSNKYNIPIIHANDSHYIYSNDSKYRTLFLKAKGINYPEEDSFILDYPDYEEIVLRYHTQGVLSENEIYESINNTLIFDECETITLINDDIKLPSISNNPTKELRMIISKAWNKEKHNVPKDKWYMYEKAIVDEIKTIEETHMEDYFIIDHKVVKKAQTEYGGKLTNTGRGSAPSFYVTKLLGLTDIDRLESPITLFPSRFMSAERILNARSLPDIDLNTANTKPFIQATQDLLGKENCAWMIAWKPLQKASAFRLYCKSIGMNIEEYDDVAKDIRESTSAHTESIYEKDKKWQQIINDSSRFVGVIESISQSPCSMLLYDKNVSEEVGLIRTVNKETNEIMMCCLLDGYNCDKYKYLKNDYLTVQVWSIIKDVCNLANIPIPSIKELNNLLDDKTYEIYSQGLTCSINQADSDFATSLVKLYSPKSVADMSAFVAVIRPGCASFLNPFIHREPLTTGVKELDDLLNDSYHTMLYQESIMKYLVWLGIPEKGTYDIIKKIAKKKFKIDELNALKTELKQGWIKQVGKEDGFEETWKVVEDASHYSFNASHSLSYAYDSLYGAYLKSHYPIEYYTVALNNYSGDDVRTNKLTDELSYFNIKLSNPKFGKSQSEYYMDKPNNTIYKGISSIKYLNNQVAKELYDLSQENNYNNFVDLIKDIKEKTSCNSRQLEILITLDFFSDFGLNGMLLEINRVYENLYSRKQIKFSDIDKLDLTTELLDKYALSKTAKMYKDIDMNNLIIDKIKSIPNKSLSIKEQLKSEIEFLGKPITIYTKAPDEFYSVIEIKTYKDKSKPYCTLYQCNTGNIKKCKITDKEFFNLAPFAESSILKVIKFCEKPKVKYVDGKWVKSNTETDCILSEWEVY